jgi:hypothetical protein
MKKARKSRVHSAALQTMAGMHQLFYLVIPYDKKQREIPSSVNCAYNSEYFTPSEALNMSQSL